MFISKKKFQQAIEKARMDAEDKVYERQRLCDMENRLFTQIEEHRQNLYRFEGDVEERLYRLEKKVFKLTDRADMEVKTRGR